jgi:hypothetical protein
MLPMGGPKGSALAIMMDVFSGVLSGSAFAASRSRSFLFYLHLTPKLTRSSFRLTKTGRSNGPLRSVQAGRRRSFLVGRQARSVHGHERVQGEVAVPVRPGRRFGQDVWGGEDLFPGRAGTDLRQGGFRSFEMRG